MPDAHGEVRFEKAVFCCVPLNNNKFHAIFNFSSRNPPDEWLEGRTAKWERGLHFAIIATKLRDGHFFPK